MEKNTLLKNHPLARFAPPFPPNPMLALSFLPESVFLALRGDPLREGKKHPFLRALLLFTLQYYVWGKGARAQH